MFDRILLAIDVNDLGGANRAATALRQIAPDGAELHVLNVVPSYGWPIVAQAMATNNEAEMKAEARERLDNWIAEQLPGAIPHILQGTIYDQILKLSKTLEVDAIVVGAHRPELQDYLVGPNAARVVRHAPQSVFVIR